ncbi:MAG: hypothetical protein ACFCU8_08970 [Thermosynechococcaceae cyanobacterium]
MNNQPQIPNAETRSRSIARMHGICEMFDKQIVMLDHLIDQVEAENQNNSFYRYCQRNKQKRSRTQLQGQP